MRRTHGPIRAPRAPSSSADTSGHTGRRPCAISHGGPVWGTRAAATAARDADVLEVRLEATDEPGLVLADDVEDDAHPVAEELVSLLPGLDPTPMGWKSRDSYLGPHADALFDRNGNAGPTIWLGGRVVGGWAQRADGGIAFRLLEDVGDDASRRVAAEAAALEAWLGGTVTVPRFRTPLERELAARGGRPSMRSAPRASHPGGLTSSAA